MNIILTGSELKDLITKVVEKRFGVSIRRIEFKSNGLANDEWTATCITDKTETNIL